MILQDVNTLIFVCAWSLAAVGVGLFSGFFIGRSFALANESGKLKSDREKTLAALLKLMSSTSQLNEDVDEHNSALVSAQQKLEGFGSDGAVENLQNELLANIERVVKSNRRLENDLVVTKYELESQAQELDRTRKEARIDALCKIGNRKAVDETLQFMISRYQTNQVSFGLMLIDVDHFKRINDTFGHAAGDEVLSSIAIALRECVRDVDFVGRLGGDEFVIMLQGVTEETAELIGTRIRSTIELYNFSVNNQGQSTVVTLSMGMAVVKPTDTPVSLYQRSDAALYKSKSLGRNRLYTLLQDAGYEPGNETPPSIDTENKQQRSTSYESFKASVSSEN